MHVNRPRTAVSGRPAPGPLLQRTVVVASRPAPSSLIRPAASARPPVRPASPGTRRVRSLAARRDAVARTAARAVAFYAIAAALIVGGVAAHEYAHFAAHEGFTVPEFTYATSVAAAQAELLSVERTGGAGEEVLLEQPKETTIVIFPNTLVQAAGLGLLPSQAYADDGVLASTYFRLDHQEATGLKSRGGQMPADVVAAPLWLAIAVFFAAAAWASWRPNLFNKALLVAYAVQLGDAGHHAGALGVDPGLFYVFSTMAIVVAGLLVALRMSTLSRNQREAGPREAGGRPHPPAPRRSPYLSVRSATDKAANRGRAHRMPARPPVTAT